MRYRRLAIKMLDILQKEEVPIDDLLNKIEVDKLTIEQLVSLYYRLFTEIEKRMTIQ